MKPYYQDECAPLRVCECGCGARVLRRFVSGHNRRGATTAATHRARLSASQAIAWATKRERMPLGSRRLDANGYWLVKVREGGGRWDKEHVLVVEESIGRRLIPGEQVHHINGIRTDNRLANLQLCADASDHMQIEATFKRLLPDLLQSGAVVYDRDRRVYHLG